MDIIREIQKKNLEQQLLFISRRRISLGIESAILDYFNFEYEDNREKINFIISLLNKVKEGRDVDIERKILSSTIRSCERIQSILLLESLPKIKNSEIMDKNIRCAMLDINEDLLGFRHYSPSIAKSPFLTELFDKLIHDDRFNLEKILSLAYQYGKYEYIEKKIGEHREESSDKHWFKFREHLLFIVRGQYEKAETFFKKNQTESAQFKFGYIYSLFLQGKKIKYKDMEEFGSMLPDSEKSWFPVFRMLFLRNGEKEIFSDSDKDKIVKSYVLGYYLFSLNRHHCMFEGKELEKLMKKYRAKFKGSLFEQILAGEIKGEKLSEYFGKNSLYYQFL